MQISSHITTPKSCRSPTILNSRSLSSFSTSSVKKAKKPNKIIPPLFSFKSKQVNQSKFDLEGKILCAMQEMKRLKQISKKLKLKEQELALLQDILIKTDDEIRDYKFNLENTEARLSELMEVLRSNNNHGIFQVYRIICNIPQKSSKKKQSFILEDIGIKNESKIVNKSARNLKPRSPYTSHSNLGILTSRAKKLNTFKFLALEPTSYDSMPFQQHPHLSSTYSRIKSLLCYLTANS